MKRVVGLDPSRELQASLDQEGHKKHSNWFCGNNKRRNGDGSVGQRLIMRAPREESEQT